MRNVYKTTHTLTKVFILFTAFLFLPLLGYYALTAYDSLTMDPNSFNCTQDSMMMEFCQNPFGQSARWVFGAAFMIAWPIFLAWTLFGIGIFVRYIFNLKKPVKNNK